MRATLLLCSLLLLNLRCGGAPCQKDPGNGCNTLRNSSAEVSEISDTGAMPAAMGGTVVDGTYHCSDYRWFVSKPDKFRRLTLQVSGGRFEFIDEQNGGANTAITTTATTGAANTITIEATCPQVATLEFDHYSATSTELRLISNTDKKVVTFARQ